MSANKKNESNSGEFPPPPAAVQVAAPQAAAAAAAAAAVVADAVAPPPPPVQQQQQPAGAVVAGAALPMADAGVGVGAAVAGGMMMMMQGDASSSSATMIRFLEGLLRQAPSFDALSRLAQAGTPGSSLRMATTATTAGRQQQQQQQQQHPPRVYSLYLQAAARHLTVEVASMMAAIQTAKATATAATTTTSTTATKKTRGKPAASATATATAGALSQEIEAYRHPLQVQQVLDAVGFAAMNTTPRSAISQSGILPVLASLGRLPPVAQDPFLADTAATNSLAPDDSIMASPGLTLPQVEFLQVAIFAEQYHYASRRVSPTWPRPCNVRGAPGGGAGGGPVPDNPNSSGGGGGGGGSHGTTPSVSVRHVLRYYYLRGTVHLACEEYAAATRCFWTVLSIPSDTTSAIMVAAWKKLVLMRCLVLSDQMMEYPPIGATTSSSSGVTLPAPLALPRVVPACFSRYLANAQSPHNPASSARAVSASNPAGQQQRQQPESMQWMEHSSTAGERPEMEVEGASQPSQAQQQQQAPSDNGSVMVVDGDTATGVVPPAPQRQHRQQQQQLTYTSLGVRVYMDLVHAYWKVDRSTFDKIVSDHGILFMRDGTMGLVQQCGKELYRRHLYYLSSIYSVIPLEQLAMFVQLSETQVHNLLLQLVVERVWPIQVMEGSIVSFPPQTQQPQRGGSSSGAGGLSPKDLDELMQLTRLVQKLDATMTASPKYATVLHKEVTTAAAAASSSSATSTGEGGPRGVEDI